MEHYLITFFLFVCYMLPAMVAYDRKHASKAGIAILNLALGWTGIGWLIALIWANSKPA